jgi:tripartite-type tricarboxylate transporter receptor subunit TctC
MKVVVSLNVLKFLLIKGACIWILLHCWTSWAQTYPAKPIRLIIPYPPGGSVDLVGRNVAKKLTDHLGQAVVIDNKGGAGARLGVEIASKAPADGYTLVVGTVTSLTMAANMFSKLPYDPIKSFEPITLLSKAPGLVTVSQNLSVKSFKEFIDYLKSHPGQVNYGSLGNGSIQHFTGEVFQSITGTQMLHVPYQGAAQELLAILGGQVQVGFEVLSSFQLQNYQSGKLRALLVAGKDRITALPNVPTAQEVGLPGFEFSAWFCLLAPAGTPQPIIQRLSIESKKALSDPDLMEVIGQQGQEPSWTSPQETQAFLEADMARWAKVVKITGFKPE